MTTFLSKSKSLDQALGIKHTASLARTQVGVTCPVPCLPRVLASKAKQSLDTVAPPSIFSLGGVPRASAFRRLWHSPVWRNLPAHAYLVLPMFPYTVCQTTAGLRGTKQADPTWDPPTCASRAIASCARHPSWSHVRQSPAKNDTPKDYAPQTGFLRSPRYKVQKRPTPCSRLQDLHSFPSLQCPLYT